MERAGHQVPSFGAELWKGDKRLGVFAGPMGAARAKVDPEARA
jgi:hypothetical protein